MTDHACGHDHPPNPYADPEQARVYHSVVVDLLGLMIPSINVDANVCGLFAALTCVTHADQTNPMPTYRAMLWEVADVVNVLTPRESLEFERVGCINPEHEHEHDDPKIQFADDTQRAFFAAAAAGDHQAAVNVADAVLTEYAEYQDPDDPKNPDMFVASFFANALVSIAFTANLSAKIQAFGDEPGDPFKH